MTDTELNLIAEKFADKLVERLKDKETVDGVVEVWGAHFDRHLGRTIRRGFYLVFTGLALWVGIKVDAFVAFFK